MTERETSDVGYMNPPEHTRFRKGKSGNPRGRPRKRDDLYTVLQRVLNRKVRVKDDERKLPIRDALIWALRGLALHGDKQALALQRRIVDESGLGRIDPYCPEELKRSILRGFEKMGIEVIRSADEK